jgi:glycolate oxidase FAD binding subunit
MSSDANTAVRPFAELIGEIERKEPADYPVDEMIPDHVVRPASVDELSELIRSVRADGLAAIPWGGGTQMGVGNMPARYDVGIDLTSISDVIRYDSDDMTMSVQAGCRLNDLNRMLGEHRQVLPVDAAFPDTATIGGLTAVGASGPRRLGYGPLRDLIIGMSIMNTDGVVTKAGGQVVKNVTGFDMMRLHHGALGSLGIIISINLKVIPKPQSERTVIALFDSLDDADAAARAVMQSQLGVTALVVTDASSTAEATDGDHEAWAIAVRCEAPPSAVVRQAERVTEYVSGAATDVRTEESTDASIARWDAICKALDQRSDSPDIVLRIGSAASRLRKSAETAERELEEFAGSRLTLDYGSGLLYVRVPRSSVSASGVEEIFTGLAGAGDHAAILTAPADFKSGLDVFGPTPSGFETFESLKNTFDPEHLLSPGRLPGRL